MKYFKYIIKSIITKLLSPIFIKLPIYNQLVFKYCPVNSKGWEGSNFSINYLLFRLIDSTFWYYYWDLPNYERKYYQEKLMGGDIGINWAKHYEWDKNSTFPPQRGEIKVGSLDFHDSMPIYEKLDSFLDGAKNPLCIIQIGASSGKEISYFSSKHKNHIFYYTDIYDSVTNYAKSNLKLPNLEFITCSAENIPIIVEMTDKHNVLIFSSGSSQYVYPEDIDLLFDRLSKINKNIYLFFNEPGNDLLNDPITFEGSYPRANFSYTHNYSYYANKHEFLIKEWQKISPYTPQHKLPLHKGIVLLFGMFTNAK